MKILSLIIFVTLSAIALLHVYWGLGGLWPAKTAENLIKTVVGAPGMTQMFGVGITLTVASLIFAAGLVALLASGLISLGPNWFARLGAGVLTFIFIGRGVAGYYAAWRGMEQTQPFASYDLWLYSPLCLGIGFSFALLTLNTR